MSKTIADKSLAVVSYALDECDGDGMETAGVICRALMICVKALGMRLNIELVTDDADPTPQGAN